MFELKNKREFGFFKTNTLGSFCCTYAKGHLPQFQMNESLKYINQIFWII